MKKLFGVFVLLLLCSSNSYAVFFADAFGTYRNAGDMETQMGGGAGLGFDIRDDLNLVLRGAFSSKTDNPNTDNEISYEHNTFLLGVEYIPEIIALRTYHLTWKTSILAGWSESSVDFNNSTVTGKESAEDSGFACAFWTGIQYDLTQVISPYLDLGYHYSRYTNDFEDASIKGYQVALGVRFYFTGNRDYTGEYQ